jgi:hypothetical protein
MLDKDVISEDFEIEFNDGEIVQFLKTDTREYQWALTQSGGIIIYEKQMHQTFGAVLKDGRLRAYPQGSWKEVRVIEKVEEQPKDYAV